MIHCQVIYICHTVLLQMQYCYTYCYTQHLYMFKSSQLLIPDQKYYTIYTLYILQYFIPFYGVTLGDDGKDMLPRGVWIKNRGLFTLGSPL